MLSPCALLETKGTPKKTEIVLKRFPASNTPPADRSALRAAVLAAATAAGSVTALRWGDDAGLASG